MAPSASHWGFDVGGGGWGNHELESYTSRTQNASLDGLGHLAIVARKVSYAGSDGITRAYTSARLSTRRTFSYLYGTAEARIRVPAGDGLWPAFWLLGSNIVSVGWPWCGEIEAMETVNSATIMSVNAHGPNPAGQFAWQEQSLGPRILCCRLPHLCSPVESGLTDLLY